MSAFRRLATNTMLAVALAASPPLAAFKNRSLENSNMADKAAEQQLAISKTDPVKAGQDAVKVLKVYYDKLSPEARDAFINGMKFWNKQGEKWKTFQDAHKKAREADENLGAVWAAYVLKEKKLSTKPNLNGFLRFIEETRRPFVPKPLRPEQMETAMSFAIPDIRKKAPDRNSIELLVKNKDNIDNWVKDKKNQERLLSRFYERFTIAMGFKKGFVFQDIAGKWPDLFSEAVPLGIFTKGKFQTKLKPEERLLAIRVILFGYAALGNPNFAKEVSGFEIAKLTRLAIVAVEILGDEEKAKKLKPEEKKKYEADISALKSAPLDVETMISLAAYLRRAYAEDKKEGDGLKLEPLVLAPKVLATVLSKPIVAEDWMMDRIKQCLATSTNRAVVESGSGIDALYKDKPRLAVYLRENELRATVLLFNTTMVNDKQLGSAFQFGTAFKEFVKKQDDFGKLKAYLDKNEGKLDEGAGKELIAVAKLALRAYISEVRSLSFQLRREMENLGEIKVNRSTLDPETVLRLALILRRASLLEKSTGNQKMRDLTIKQWEAPKVEKKKPEEEKVIY